MPRRRIVAYAAAGIIAAVMVVNVTEGFVGWGKLSAIPLAMFGVCFLAAGAVMSWPKARWWRDKAGARLSSASTSRATGGAMIAGTAGAVIGAVFGGIGLLMLYAAGYVLVT
jgi:hypothetical protein